MGLRKSDFNPVPPWMVECASVLLNRSEASCDRFTACRRLKGMHRTVKGICSEGRRNIPPITSPQPGV